MSETSKAIRDRRRSRQQKEKQIKAIGLMLIGAIIVVAAGIGLKVAADNAKEMIIPDARDYSTADMNGLGDPNAPVTVEVYSSFSCSHCYAWFIEEETQFIENYVDTGEVYYIYHPFDSDTTSIYTKAANAALCAGEQGKFWELHDIVFANSYNGYTLSTLDEMAEYYGLDMEAFGACMDDGQYYDTILESTENAYLNLGITGTPTFVVNGEIGMVGNEGYEYLAQVVENALAAMDGE